MLGMTANELLEDDDDEFFADAIRSLSKLESSSLKYDGQNAHKNSLERESNSFLNNNDSTTLNIETVSPLLNSSEKFDIKRSSNLDSEYEKSIKYATVEKQRSSHLNVQSTSVNKGEDGLNHRFMPGFTSKATKRKFSGPIGTFIDECTDEFSNNSNNTKRLSVDENDIANISSSQLSTDELLQSVSWQKLQEDISLNPILVSTAKKFSIQEVFNETSKKKLPKHIIVPLLCVYLKKFNTEDSESLFMDDTGEINGKISKDIMEKYGSLIKSGTSLTIKEVTFMCNVMLLEESNLISLYTEDGLIQHVQNFEKESSKPLECIFPITPKQKLKPLSPKNKETLVPDKKSDVSSHVFNPQHSNYNSPGLSLSHKISQNNQNIHLKHCTSTDPDLESDVMDEFDELLGNIDEKSFLEDF